MTNLEYVRSLLTDRDIADLLCHRTPDIIWKISNAHTKWAQKFSDQKGNGTYNTKTGEEYTGRQLPSIWSFEYWFHADNTKTREGRSRNVSIQVWLSHQYDPAEWEN